jgi:DNA-binding transcriptional MerR regulator
LENSLENKLYKPGEVSGIVNIGTDLLRKYSDFFNIQTEWTQPNQKGHRRYSKQNVEELIAIKKKIQEQNWTWDQVLAWRNGEEEAFFKDHQERSVLEKKIDQLLESQVQMREHQKQQEQFNQALIKRLEEVSQHKHQLEKYIEEKLQSRDQLLLESLRKTQEDKKKRKGIFRFFG